MPLVFFHLETVRTAAEARPPVRRLTPVSQITSGLQLALWFVSNAMLLGTALFVVAKSSNDSSSFV